MKTEKPKVRKRIKYLEKCLDNAQSALECAEALETGWEDDHRVEIRLYEKLLKCEYEILYFEDDIITFDELMALMPDKYYLFYYPIEFNYKNVDYHTVYVSCEMVSFKKTGRGNNKEIIIYRR
jgi:hypothetical protein